MTQEDIAPNTLVDTEHFVATSFRVPRDISWSIHSVKLNWASRSSLRCSTAQTCHKFPFKAFIFPSPKLRALSKYLFLFHREHIPQVHLNLDLYNTSHSCCPCWHSNFKNFPFRSICKIVADLDLNIWTFKN